MKKIAFVLMFVLAPSIVFAQGEWQLSGDLSLNVTQNAYSDSWTGGEAGTVSWVSIANMIAEKQLSSKYHWRNTGKFSFGQIHNQNPETNDWEKPEKSTDKIDIESVLKMTLGAAVDPYIAFRLESQFLDNSIPEVKRLFNPILLTESAGASRTLYKEEKRGEVLTRLGLAIRQRIDREVVTIEPEETTTETTTDGGLEWVTDVNYVITPEKLRYESKLSVFQAFFNSRSDELEGESADYWKAPDLNWENIITASINQYVQVSLYTQLLYDKEIDKRGRFKETLALGVTYKLF